jgi:hypothetical protein
MSRVADFHFPLQVRQEARNLLLDHPDLLFVFRRPGCHSGTQADGTQGECAGLLEFSAAEKSEVCAPAPHLHKKALGFADLLPGANPLPP